MTYERFATEMLDRKSDLKRKDIRSFTIKFALLVGIASMSAGLLVSKILGSFFLILFLILALFLYIWSFDLFVENDNLYKHISRMSRFWWLYSAIIVAICVAINTFVL